MTLGRFHQPADAEPFADARRGMGAPGLPHSTTLPGDGTLPGLAGARGANRVGAQCGVAQKLDLRVQPEDMARTNGVATRVASARADLGGFERSPETGEAARNCEKTGFLVNFSRLPVPPLGLEPRT